MGAKNSETNGSKNVGNFFVGLDIGTNSVGW